MGIVGKSQSGRACAEPTSRPSAPRSGGGAKRRALTSVSTRARCWLDDAAGDHNILRSTRVQLPSVPRARQQFRRPGTRGPSPRPIRHLAAPGWSGASGPPGRRGPGRARAQTSMPFEHPRQPDESWWSTRRGICRWLGGRFFRAPVPSGWTLTMVSAVARKSVILDGTSTTTCRGCMSEHRRQEPVWTSVRGAGVKAVSPRSGGGAKRRALTSVRTRARCWLDDAAGDHDILRSTRVQFLSVPRARQQWCCPATPPPT